MGCNMSVSKAASNPESSTGGKTLLKSHTAALNGDGSKSPAKAYDGEPAQTSTDDYTGTAETAGEPAAEPPADGEQITPLVPSKDQVDEVGFGPTDSMVPQIAEVETGTPSEPLKPTEEEAPTTSSKRVSIPEDEIQKPLEPTERKEAVQAEKDVANSSSVVFFKGDFVNIVGPTANGSMAFKGKTGRVMQIDGGSIPYEVLVEQEKAWFKTSSLEKMKALNVTVSVPDENSSCCSGNAGLFGCCTDAKR